MALLAKLASYGTATLMFAFAAVVAWRILDGSIVLNGLLDTAGSGNERAYSPARLQLLVSTLIVAAQYLITVWRNPSREALPPAPGAMVALAAVSQTFYIVSKARGAYRRIARKTS